MPWRRNRFNTFSISSIFFGLTVLLVLSRLHPSVAQFQDHIIHRLLNPVFSIFHSQQKETEMSKMERVQRELKELKNKIVELEETKINFDRLNAAHHFLEKSPYKSEIAKIITFDAVQGVKSVLINKGNNAGILKGQAVIALDGVVGVVAKVNPTDAMVLLLIDPAAAIDGEIRPSGARGLVHGRRKNLGLNREYWITRMEYLGYSDELHEKDLVVTSGLDLVFPAGIPIGKIEKINRDEKGLFMSADLVPEVDFSKLSEVIVVQK